MVFANSNSGVFKFRVIYMAFRVGSLTRVLRASRRTSRILESICSPRRLLYHIKRFYYPNAMYRIGIHELPQPQPRMSDSIGTSSDSIQAPKYTTFTRLAECCDTQLLILYNGSRVASVDDQLDGISNLKLTTASVPQPTGKQILVRINAVSLNYKDGETISGLFKHHKTSVAPANLIPCSDSAGIITATGPDVTKWKVGDRVLSTSYPNFLTGQVQAHHLAEGTGGSVHGVLCQYRLFEEHAVVRTPGYLTDVEACNFQIAGTTAWMAINGFRPIGQPGGKGETILIQGTGGVSIMGLLIR